MGVHQPNMITIPGKRYSSTTPWSWDVYTLVEYLCQGRRSLEEAHASLKSGPGEPLCAGNPGILDNESKIQKRYLLGSGDFSQAEMWEDGQGRAFYNGRVEKGWASLVAHYLFVSISNSGTTIYRNAIHLCFHRSFQVGPDAVPLASSYLTQSLPGSSIFPYMLARSSLQLGGVPGTPQPKQSYYLCVPTILYFPYHSSYHED